MEREESLAGNKIVPSECFDRAVHRFTNSLSPRQKREFTSCSLEEVYDSITDIQNEHGSRHAMRNMARITAFLEGMDEYRKVVEAFLNCTPFMGYVWVRYYSNKKLPANADPGVRDLSDSFFS